MALAFNRTLIVPVDTETINTTATFTSPEQDIGDDTIAEQIWMYVDVAGFAAAPAGNKLITVKIAAVHTASGTVYSDACATYYFAVAADQAYAFSTPLLSLPRYFKVLVLNDTSQNTDADAVSVRIEYQAVTA